MAAPMATHAENSPALILSILKSNEDVVMKNDPSVLDVVVNSSLELRSFRKEGSSVADLAGYINKCLTVSSTRVIGLALLEPLAAQISAQQFQQHCTSWIRLLTQILQPYSNVSHVKLAAVAVTSLLSKASRHPDISREVASNLIHPLVENALQLKDEKVQCSIQVLDGCMRYFPGPCGPMRNQLLNHVTYILGNEQNDKTVESSCRCFALLPSIGGGGAGGVLHQEAWGYYMKKLINTVKQVLSELYKDYKTGITPPSDDEPTLPLPVVPSDEPEGTFALAKQSQRLLTAMTELLQNNFPVTVIIPHNDIVSLVCNVLAVNGKILTLKGSLQASYLMMVISDVHRAAFKLLTSLILRCGSHLLVHVRTINQLILQTLNWTATLDDTDTLQFSKLRSEVYRTYDAWLTTLGASAYMGENTATLVAHVIKDAHLQEKKQHEESSKIDPAGVNDSGPPKRKKQKKHHQWRVQPVGGWGSKQEGDPCMEQLCTDALRALRSLFLTCGSRMKWTLHRTIHTLTVKVLLQCQSNLRLASVAYHSPICRKELYRVLLSCLLVPSPHWSAPLQSSVHIFSQGRLDPDIEVKQFCLEAAAVMENLTHPRSPQIPCPILPPPAESKEDSFDLSSVIFPGYKITPMDLEGTQDAAQELGEGKLKSTGLVASSGLHGVLDQEKVEGSERLGEAGKPGGVTEENVRMETSGDKSEEQEEIVGNVVNGSKKEGSIDGQQSGNSSGSEEGSDEDEDSLAGDEDGDDVKRGKMPDEQEGLEQKRGKGANGKKRNWPDDNDDAIDKVKRGKISDVQEGLERGEQGRGTNDKKRICQGDDDDAVGITEEGEPRDEQGVIPDKPRGKVEEEKSSHHDQDVLDVAEDENRIDTDDAVNTSGDKTSEPSVADMLASFSAEGPDSDS